MIDYKKIRRNVSLDQKQWKEASRSRRDLPLFLLVIREGESMSEKAAESKVTGPLPLFENRSNVFWHSNGSCKIDH
jgi:hypothetical protein